MTCSKKYDKTKNLNELAEEEKERETKCSNAIESSEVIYRI